MIEGSNFKLLCINEIPERESGISYLKKIWLIQLKDIYFVIYGIISDFTD